MLETPDGRRFLEGRGEACLARTTGNLTVLYLQQSPPERERWKSPAAPQHNVHAPGDTDYVKFAAVGGVTYLIRTTNLSPSSENDTTLTLYDVDGTTVLAYSDEHSLEPAGASRIDWLAPATGTYFVRAQQFNPAAHGCTMTFFAEVAQQIPQPLNTSVYLPLVH